MIKSLNRAFAGAVAALAVSGAAVASPIQAELTLHADRPGPSIAPDIYGQFSEHLGHGVYDGIWVGEGSAIPNTRGVRNDVVGALKQIGTPLVRWPGGCFADIYHWRDGIGPRAERPVRLNTTWGGVEESNAFGLHEFMDFAGQVGAGAYINVNVGTGSPAEMADLLEYMTSDSHSALAELRRKNGRQQPWKIAWLGIGNEPWGCGGSMRAEHYADLVRQYATFVRLPQDARPKLIASGAQPDDYHWTDVLMSTDADQIDGYSLHYYTVPTGEWAHKGAATGFGEDLWISTLSQALKMDGYVTRHAAIMDRYDPKKRIALVVDEWGTWDDPKPGTNAAFLEQDATLKDALVAALTLNIFQQHADRVRMAAIAQTVNVLQSMALTKGGRMVLTPTYYVYEMYRPFQGATSLPIEVSAPAYAFGGVSVPSVQASAARDAYGVVHVALVNLDPHETAHAAVRIDGAAERTVSGRVLTAGAMDAANSFDRPDTVTPKAFGGARIAGGVLSADLPPKSVVVLDLH